MTYNVFSGTLNPIHFTSLDEDWHTVTDVANVERESNMLQDAMLPF